MHAQVIHGCYQLLANELALEARATSGGVPKVHVVPGSYRMNTLSGTKAFKMAVVRWVGDCR